METRLFFGRVLSSRPTSCRVYKTILASVILKDAVVKEAVQPDGLDNDGFIENEDFILILSKFSQNRIKEFQEISSKQTEKSSSSDDKNAEISYSALENMHKFNDAFIHQVVRALNPYDNKFGVKILTARLVLKNIVAEETARIEKLQKEETYNENEEDTISLYSIAEKMALQTE